jgi:hypothetical protein
MARQRNLWAFPAVSNPTTLSPAISSAIEGQADEEVSGESKLVSRTSSIQFPTPIETGLAGPFESSLKLTNSTNIVPLSNSQLIWSQTASFKAVRKAKVSHSNSSSDPWLPDMLDCVKMFHSDEYAKWRLHLLVNFEQYRVDIGQVPQLEKYLETSWFNQFFKSHENRGELEVCSHVAKEVVKTRASNDPGNSALV